MGTRLYPNTKDTAKLEKLAGVPAGTAKLLDLWNDMKAVYLKHIDQVEDFIPFTGDEFGYQCFAMFHGTDIAKYDDFLLYGWGKFDYSLLDEADKVCGQVPVGRLACQLLATSTGFKAHGVELWDILDIVVESEGVYWG